MTALFVNILAFLGAFLTVFGANAVIADVRMNERKRMRQRMEEQYRVQQRERAKRAASSKDFSQIAADAKDEGERERNLYRWLLSVVEQSGLDLSVSTVLSLMGAGAVVFGLAVGVFLSDPLYGLLAGLVGGALPLLFVMFKRQRRLEKLRTQLPDAFDLMSRVLRSGQTVSQAMQAVAQEFDRPISLEFLFCYEQMNLGLSPEAALRQLGTRTGLLEVKIFILAVLVHRQTGGNLAELLDKLAAVVRDRFRILGMIRSLTAQGRLQAGILLSLPPFMFVLLLFINYEYEVLLLHYPVLIAAALGMMAIGALWIRKIVNFDF